MEIFIAAIGIISGVPDREGAIALLKEIEPGAEIKSCEKGSGVDEDFFIATYSVRWGVESGEAGGLPPGGAEEQSEAT